MSTINTTTNLAMLPDGILTATQLKGLSPFNAPDKGNCYSTTDYTNADGTFLSPLFTDFTYDNLGIPTNSRVKELSGVAQPN